MKRLKKIKKIIKGKLSSLFLILSCLTVFACSNKEPLPPISSSDYEETEQDGTIEVPFTESGGVKIIKVKVNGIDMQMILDSGASATCISLTEARFLYKQGLLTDEDIMGESASRIADGSIVPNIMVNLKEITIDDQISFTNVKAMVSLSLNAPLLLGNEDVLNTCNYTVDNDNKVIIFEKY